MKQCPTCKSNYTDDTLQFCLQDGSPLQPAPGAFDESSVYGEQETVVSGRPSNQIDPPPVTSPTAWNPNQYESNAAVQPAAKKSNATVAVFLTVFVMLLLFSFVGIGAWLYFRGATPDDRGNLLIAEKSPDPEIVANRTTTAPVDASKATPQATVAANAAKVDKEQLKRDVAQKISSWSSAAEARDLDEYMRNYADSVDYYNKRRASLATVRADKQRAFSAYDSIRFTISNLDVTPGADGETATAVFDKEWVFEGAKYSAGKVQSQLKLKRANGDWRITGERDLKVYYTE
ncbi:MAG TPA: hypothetical protein VIL74_24875 [Pyrinomonadaceae bacterium]|jgi:ketosteroid isomerase-like protein